MANSVWQGTVQDASGNIVTGAEISVYDEGTGTLATIYSDIGGTALTNPFFSDSNGFAQFYATAGQYRITAVESGSGLNQTFRHVRLGEAGSVDTGTASDEVPLNSDLADVLRDSDIGQTVSGLSNPGDTNWDSGNLQVGVSGGVGVNRMMKNISGSLHQDQDLVPGSDLQYALGTTSNTFGSSSAAPPGTWRLTAGHSNANNAYADYTREL